MIGQADSTLLRGVMRAGNSANRKHCDWPVALPDEESSPTCHPTWPRPIIRQRPISTWGVGPVYARVNTICYNTLVRERARTACRALRGPLHTPYFNEGPHEVTCSNKKNIG